MFVRFVNGCLPGFRVMLLLSVRETKPDIQLNIRHNPLPLLSRGLNASAGNRGHEIISAIGECTPDGKPHYRGLCGTNLLSGCTLIERT